MAKEKKPINKLSAEKDFADLIKHINEQNFGSTEELQNFLNQTIGKRVDEIIPKKKGRQSAKEKAQALLYEAYEATPAKGRKLAVESIKLDPSNADAYVFLAENASDLDKAIEYYTMGLEVGRESIGPKEFKEFEGHFWGVHETRPFMRAKAGLAYCLQINNQPEEAIKHFQEMLVLNPGDNQGVRYQLAICLVEQNNKKEYLKLFQKFEEGHSAIWLYTYALFLFKQEGDTPKSNQALKDAYTANRMVFEFLTCRKEMPNYVPQYIGIGDENEAICCVNDSGRIWLETKGALKWINTFYQRQKRLN